MRLFNYVHLIFFLSLTILLQADEWLIIANGSSLAVESLKTLAKDRKIMMLDGAINRFKGGELLPDVLLGDFDSLEDMAYWGVQKEALQPYKGSFGILIVPAPDQDYTDLEKGIMYCDSQGAKAILIVQAIGFGRLDHTLANIGDLRKYYNPSRPILLQTETERVEFIKDSTTTIEGKIGDQCAIMGYPEATMTTIGLKYNGQDYPLRLGIQESVCNTLAEPQAIVVIKGEAIVIKPIN